MKKFDPVCHRVPGSDEVGLAVWEYPGEGPPLLLFHCNGTCGRMWEPVIAALDGRFHVFAPDARGHGASDTPPPGPAYEWEAMGADVLAVVDGLGLENTARLAGHSLGGASVAYALLHRPELARRAVLLDAIIGPPEFFIHPAPLAAVARRRVHHFPDAASALERLGGKPPMSAWTRDSLETYIRYGFDELPDGSLVLKCPREVEAEIFERGGACSAFARLGEINGDVLVVTGAESNVRLLADLQAGMLQKPVVRVLPGVHHFIPQEQPEETASLIAEWLG